MLDLFLHNLLPIFLVAGAGWVLAARFGLDPRPVTHLAFWILAPCFVFRLLLASDVGGDALARMVAFTVLALAGPAALAGLVAWRLGASRGRIAAIVLVVLLPNAGNYGLPATRFAFGEGGLAQAGVFFVTASVLTYTAGVLVASLGGAPLGKALAGLPRVPVVWSVVLAIAARHFGWTLPVPAARAVDLLADACIPVFLVILGMQLRGKGVRAPLGALAGASAARLVLGAAAGIALAPVLGLGGPARQAAILESAMPSAVIATVLAAEYDAEPRFVTAVVVVTTLASPLTLTPLLRWLGAG